MEQSTPLTVVRPGTKQAMVLAMLRRESGAGISDLVTATGWQANTVHAALTTLRKQGVVVLAEPSEQGKRYRIRV